MISFLLCVWHCLLIQVIWWFVDIIPGAKRLRSQMDPPPQRDNSGASGSGTVPAANVSTAQKKRQTKRKVAMVDDDPPKNQPPTKKRKQSSCHWHLSQVHFFKQAQLQLQKPQVQSLSLVRRARSLASKQEQATTHCSFIRSIPLVVPFVIPPTMLHPQHRCH